MLGKKLGIDLGSACVRLHIKGEGVTATEPAVAAIVGSDGGGGGGDEGDRGARRVVGIGLAALREAEEAGAELRSALRGGSIADRLALEALIQGMVQRACGRQRIFKPEVMVAVPSPLVGPERRTVLEVCARAGARTMYLIDAPMAAALGAGERVQSPRGRLCVDIGAGSVDAALIASEGIASAGFLARGGAALTADIARHLSAVHGVSIPVAQAEEAKREIAGAVPFAEERTLRLPCGPGDSDGGAATAGVEGEVVVSSGEVAEAMGGWLVAVVEMLSAVLDEAPPRLAEDVRRDTGVVLCGGGSRLRGLDRHLGSALGLRVRLADDPATCTARGTGAALDSLDVMRRSFLYVR